MLPDPEHILSQSAQITKNSWLPYLIQVWDEHRTFVDAYLSLARKGFGTTAGQAVKLQDSQKDDAVSHLSLLLEKYNRPERSPDFDNEFVDFHTETTRWAGFFQLAVKDLQPETAMIAQEDDTLWLRTGKWFKRNWFHFSRAPWTVTNRMRAMVGKSKVAIPPMYRQVPLQKVIQHYVGVKLPEELISIVYIPLFHRMRKEVEMLMEIGRIVDNHSSEKKDISASREFHMLLGQLRREKHYPFEELVNMAVENSRGYLEQALRKSGTLELPTRSFNPSRTSKERKRVGEHYRKVALDAHLRLNGKLDEWQARIALHALSQHVAKGGTKARASIQGMVAEKYSPPLASIRNFLQDQLVSLEKEKNTLWVSDMLSRVSVRIKSELQEMIVPDALEVFGDNEIILAAQNFTALLGESAIHLPDKAEVISLPDDEDAAINRKAVTEVQIRQLVETDCLPPALQSLGDENLKMASALLHIRDMVSETGRIAEYNMETAESLAEISEEQSRARQIAIEGIERAIARINEAGEALSRAAKSMDERMDVAVGDIQTKVSSYLEPETLLDARTRILKAKAIQQSEQILVKIRQHLYTAFRFSSLKLKKVFKKLAAYYQRAREYMGVVEQEILVAPEISDFLAESQRAISRLPYVYQRLFVLSPLEDEYFFRGRKKEIDRITAAFTNWQEGRYAPTVIIGETGSGITSLINLYVKNHLAGQPLFRYEVNQSVSKEDDLCAMLGVAFAGKPFADREEMFQWFDGLENRPVIILEGIQRLFLRTIHGFGAIRLFAELISATNKRVFWITSCNLYGWQYIDKTLRYSDFFGYLVELQSLSEQEVVDVILRRHVASGYNLRFELPESAKLDKKLEKLVDEADQQKYLKDKYFAALNSFARSNIAISMLLWLRSAREVKGNEITIALPKGLDASFVKTFSRDKLFMLHALLLHDGLSDEQLASVLNFLSTRTRLLIIQLYDDGVIVLKNGLYSANPLLYRQVVSTLRDANLIH